MSTRLPKQCRACLPQHCRSCTVGVPGRFREHFDDSLVQLVGLHWTTSSAHPCVPGAGCRLTSAAHRVPRYPLPAVARTSCSRRRLSRDSARLSSSASHGVVQRSASPPSALVESSPAPKCFGPALPGAGLGPPSWFLTTLTVSSSSRGVGLLRPTTDHEVHRVLCSAVPRRTGGRARLADATPSRAFPSPAASAMSPSLPSPSPLRAAHPLDLEALLR
jgi:hypothetical protein